MTEKQVNWLLGNIFGFYNTTFTKRGDGISDLQAAITPVKKIINGQEIDKTEEVFIRFLERVPTKYGTYLIKLVQERDYKGFIKAIEQMGFKCVQKREGVAV